MKYSMHSFRPDPEVEALLNRLVCLICDQHKKTNNKSFTVNYALRQLAKQQGLLKDN